MKFVAIVATAAVLGVCAPAHAGCMPVNSEVVSLGEKAARFYSERSLAQQIDDEKQRVKTTGAALGPITKAMTCAPFPNLIGADEWRCVGDGKVCSK